MAVNNAYTFKSTENGQVTGTHLLLKRQPHNIKTNEEEEMMDGDVKCI